MGREVQPSLALYAKHPQDTEAGVVDVLTGKWVPTVVNPAESVTSQSLMTERALFGLHIIVWVVALALNAVVGFGAGSFMSNSTNATYFPAGGTTGDPDGGGGSKWDPSGSGYGYGSSDTVNTIGILGGVFTILGVVCLLGFASIWNAEQYKETVWANALTQFFTVYGTCSTVYIFMESSENTDSGFYWLSLFATIFTFYAQILLFCTSSTLEVVMLPRIFIPSFTLSVQFINALSIQSGDYTETNGTPFTSNEKLIGWLVPITTGAAFLLMVLIRRFTRINKDGLDVTEMNKSPFLRSLILTCFLGSALLSVYKLAMLKSGTNTAYMFGLTGLLLNFVIVSVVFVPGGGAFGTTLAKGR